MTVNPAGSVDNLLENDIYSYVVETLHYYSPGDFK
jgi:hypothetical protein